MNIISKLASICQNHILGGLEGFHPSLNISLQQLEDEVIQTRMAIMQKYAILNLLPYKDLYLTINCVDVDCLPMGQCCDEAFGEPLAHFEIPQIYTGAGDESILFIGSINKQVKFKVYTSPTIFKYHKYKTRGSKKPYVFLDLTPNKNNYIDGYIFNAPMLEKISVSAIFKDPRELDVFLCCDYDFENYNNLSWIDTETVDTVVNKYLKYYRLLYPQQVPNDQVPR